MSTPRSHVRSRLMVLLPALIASSAPGACDWPSPDPEGETCAEINVQQANITVDGQAGDWAGIAPRLVRPAGAPPLANGYSLGALYVAADAEHLYLRIDAVGSTPPCGNGVCENDLGEDGSTCPADCSSSTTAEFRVHLKTSGFRWGEITIYGSYGNPWTCQGNWHSNDSNGSGSSITCNVTVQTTAGTELVLELALKRAELGAVVNLYPTWGHCCENDQGPVIDDEIGCVWSRL